MADKNQIVQNNVQQKEDIKIPIQPTFRTDWKSRKPFERVSFGLGAVAVLMGIPAIVGLWNHSIASTSTLLIFTVQNVFLIILFSSLVFRERMLRLKAESELTKYTEYFDIVLSLLAGTFHNLSHKSRDLMCRVHTPPRPLPVPETAKALSSFCDRIKSLFDAIFAQEGIVFHATIKAIIESDGKTTHTICTLARDFSLREHHNSLVQDSKRQYIHGNTAFEFLLDSEETHFCDDDLPNRMDYKNTSPNWRDRYNSTLVVPIRRSHVEQGNVFELVGIIGIDCKRPPNIKNVFCSEVDGKVRRELKDILLGYADCIYVILKRGTTYSGPYQALPGDYRIDLSNLGFVSEIHNSYLGRDLPPSPEAGA